MNTEDQQETLISLTEYLWGCPGRIQTWCLSDRTKHLRGMAMMKLKKSTLCLLVAQTLSSEGPLHEDPITVSCLWGSDHHEARALSIHTQGQKTVMIHSRTRILSYDVQQEVAVEEFHVVMEDWSSA